MGSSVAKGHNGQPREPLRRVGGLWKPRPGAKSFGSGTITVNGMMQKFIVLRNDKKEPGSNQPDYTLVSNSDPTPDPYAQLQSQDPPRRAEPRDADLGF